MPKESMVLGDFELRRVIGRGGMGAVYEAWQTSLQRIVALKILAQHISASPKAIQRFQREAHAAAKLHHTHIVPIFAQGEQDGVYYYAMELIDGPSLNAIIAGARGKTETPTSYEDPDETVELGGSSATPSEPADAAETQPIKAVPVKSSDSAVFFAELPEDYSSQAHFAAVAEHVATIADALEYAHTEGVVHRDIKPHNLILGRDGRMRISDFGLARVSEQPGMTITGELIGSPLYMSPEQIMEGPSKVDHRTDIYSLGATMYEWLVLTPPNPGETRERVISRILQSEPRPLRMLNPQIPIDLETICLKALERDRARRYQTAGEMRDDLRRFLDSTPIKAKRVGLPTRIGKFIGRHQVGSITTVAAVVAIASGLAVYWKQQEIKVTQRQVASQRAAAEQAREESENLFEMLSEMLPLEIELPRRAVQAARPYVEDILPQPGVALPTGAEDWRGADSAEVGTPVGIARRAIRDLYESSAPAYWPSSPLEYECSDALLGSIDLRAREPGRSRQLVDQCLLSQPDHINARRLHAALSGQMRQYDTMASDAYVLIRRRSEEATGHLWLGLAHMLLGDPQRSLSDLNAALSLAGRDETLEMWSYVLQGLAFLQLERPNEGLLEFNEALALSPKLVVALLGRSCAIARLKDWSGAVADLTRVIDLEPENAAVLALRGEHYVRLGEYEAAIEDFDTAKEIAGGLNPSTIASWMSAWRQKNLAETPDEPAVQQKEESPTAETDRSSNGRVLRWLYGAATSPARMLLRVVRNERIR